MPKRPKITPAFVLAGIALFVALSSSSYAATGEALILGQTNDATTKTSLSAKIGGAALQISNNKTTKPDATALALDVASGHAPFSTNSSTRVVNLNADELDGVDSTGYTQGNATVRAQAFPVRLGDTADVQTGSGITIEFVCPLTPQDVGSISLLNGAGTVLNVFTDTGATDPQYDQLDDGTATQAFPVTSAGDSFTFQVQSGLGQLQLTHVGVVQRATDCHFQYEMIDYH